MYDKKSAAQLFAFNYYKYIKNFMKERKRKKAVDKKFATQNNIRHTSKLSLLDFNVCLIESFLPLSSLFVKPVLSFDLLLKEFFSK